MSAAVFFNSASELATLTNTFSVNGTPTNPTSVTLTITSPTNVVTTPTPSSTGTGAYSADITCSEDGQWQYSWVGTGTAVDTEVGTWLVQETDLGKLYCPISSLKSRLGIEHNEADFELHAACYAASRWIEQYTERIFYRTAPAARTFPPGRDIYCLRLPPYCDLVSVTSLKTDTAADGTFATTWTASDYQLLPYNALAAPEQLPYNEIRAVGALAFPWLYPAAIRGIPGRRDLIQVTGIWGWPKVPTAIRQAAAIVAADTFSLKDAPFGVEGSAEFSVQVGDNRRAMKFLDPYRRYSVLVA